MGKLVVDKSYQITATRVRSFNGTNYLTVTPESQIIPVGDIGETADGVHEDLEDSERVKKRLLNEHALYKRRVARPKKWHYKTNQSARRVTI